MDILEVKSMITINQNIPIVIKSDYSGVETFNSTQEALAHIDTLPKGTYFEYKSGDVLVARGQV